MIGKAGAGKTAAIINEIKRDMASPHGRALMIVPEQYSHEAERELCRVCGDRLSLYAEVLSFTGLARETAAKHGGGAEPWLDKGGRLLCMALARSFRRCCSPPWTSLRAPASAMTRS